MVKNTFAIFFLLGNSIAQESKDAEPDFPSNEEIRSWIQPHP
jgi:hypothetical protein